MADEKFAGIVALAIKAALAPVTERLAILETKEAAREHTSELQQERERNVELQKQLADLRDRVVLAEAKAATTREPQWDR